MSTIDIVAIPYAFGILMPLHRHAVDLAKVDDLLAHRRGMVLLRAQRLPLPLAGGWLGQRVLRQHTTQAHQQAGFVAVAQGELHVAPVDGQGGRSHWPVPLAGAPWGPVRGWAGFGQYPWGVAAGMFDP